MCEVSSADPPAPAVLALRIVSPPGVALPIMFHCWVGAAFHRIMPPKALIARLSLPSATAEERAGPVVPVDVLT